ncbi:Zn(2)-C6 fungal-type domain-containing protein [Mycena chlorophos]|uniref:Zn(2)-C6 fungal-type domain-containing protein n=1 Tax=Mycena chlorophos TaxID=658473 RepID=A0A8H6VQK4_MYCCL|nr:Zn(2)-C6 fungal-type domain-containing protein [Mycena chlorophos]
MSDAPKPKKLPACDQCKARRVMCHSRPNGEPCPRCAEKGLICLTTPLPRGRPRKNPDPPFRTESLVEPVPVPNMKANLGGLSLAQELPDLTTEFVAHCFDVIVYAPQLAHPLVVTSDIHKKLKALSYQVNLLQPQSRVLALCIICTATRASFHPLVLGSDPNKPRPESFTDVKFFANASNAEILDCGVRRMRVFNILRAQALMAAWEAGIVVQPSNENAASCYLLDQLDQGSPAETSTAARPWATAYMSHIRILAPLWHSAGFTATSAAEWAGFLMGEALLSTRNRTALLITWQDQMLLSGPEPPTLESMLASLEKASSNPSLTLLWGIVRPFLFHIPVLARILYEDIAGGMSLCLSLTEFLAAHRDVTCLKDYARLSPLSESAVIKMISSLTVMHSIISIVLGRVDAALAGVVDSPLTQSAVTTLDGTNVGSAARAASYAAVFSFIGLVLPLYRELEYREATDLGLGRSNTAADDFGMGGPGLGDAADTRKHQRLRLLRLQVHGLAVNGGKLLAKGFRNLPPVHYTPAHWGTVFDWAKFFADEADAALQTQLDGSSPLSEEDVADLHTIVRELVLTGYTSDAASTPAGLLVLERLEQHIQRAKASWGR